MNISCINIITHNILYYSISTDFDFFFWCNFHSQLILRFFDSACLEAQGTRLRMKSTRFGCLDLHDETLGVQAAQELGDSVFVSHEMGREWAAFDDSTNSTQLAKKHFWNEWLNHQKIIYFCGPCSIAA